MDDLSGHEVAQLLNEHLQDMYATSPVESVHALGLSTLRQSNIKFWTIWDEQMLAGCGALKTYSATSVEIKSMRVANAYRRQGVAAQLLQHILHEAKCAGAKTVYLETGSMAFLHQQDNFTPSMVLSKLAHLLITKRMKIALLCRSLYKSKRQKISLN